MILMPLIDNILNPAIVFIPNAVNAKKTENAKMEKINQYCRIVGLKDWIIFVSMLLVKTVSLFTVFICVLSFSIHHEFPVKCAVSTIFYIRYESMPCHDLFQKDLRCILVEL